MEFGPATTKRFDTMLEIANDTKEVVYEVWDGLTYLNTSINKILTTNNNVKKVLDQLLLNNQEMKKSVDIGNKWLQRIFEKPVSNDDILAKMEELYHAVSFLAIPFGHRDTKYYSDYVSVTRKQYPQISVPPDMWNYLYPR